MIDNYIVENKNETKKRRQDLKVKWLIGHIMQAHNCANICCLITHIDDDDNGKQILPTKRCCVQWCVCTFSSQEYRI